MERTGQQGITILGSTGSVGENTLDVIRRNPGRFRVVGLSANQNARRLAEQCAEFDVAFAVIGDPDRFAELREHLAGLGARTEARCGAQALEQTVQEDGVDTVMAAIVGAAGLAPTLSAARRGLKVLLANKEALVTAGQLLIDAAISSGARILPVDSEHNAIFQALPDSFETGHVGALDECGVEKIRLTASGGPFLNTPREALASVTPEQACAHPNWDMGRKISVDSATLMNKGLELIEAHWLFGADPKQLEVLIHPQSIVHSMVCYRDGSVIAQLGTPDMRTPIAHTLAWPERIEAGVERLDLARQRELSFQLPDLDRFPALSLAYEAMKAGGSAPIVLNAANEIAVESFLGGAIALDQIPVVVERTLSGAAGSKVESIEDILEQDGRARAVAGEICRDLGASAE